MQQLQSLVRSAASAVRTLVIFCFLKGAFELVRRLLEENSRSSHCQAFGCVTADSDDLFVQEGNTRVVWCDGSHSNHDEVGHVRGDIYETLGGRVLDIHGSLCCSGIRCDDASCVHCRARGGSSNVYVPGQ